MRTTSLSLALLLGAGCGGSSETPPPPEVQTPLSGVVFLAQPAAAAMVVVRDFAGGVGGDEIARAETDERGTWSTDLGAIGGDVIVEVTTSEGLQMTSIAIGIDVDVGDEVVVSPIAHLATAYVRHLLGAGYDFDEAVLKARRLFHLHFGRTDQHSVVPNSVIGGEEVSMLTPGVVSGILLVSLVDVLEERGGGSTANALDALVRDIESDGIFDGRDTGDALGFGLDSQTLRIDYGRAIRRFLESDRNGTAFRPGDLLEVIDGIEASQSELFPSGIVDADETGPIVAEFELLNGDGAVVEPTGGVRGVARLTVRFDDPLGVDAAWIQDGTGAMLSDQLAAADVVSATIDTTAIPDGEVSYTIVALDGGENETRMELRLVVDNTAPILMINPPGISPNSPITITGTVTDATSGVELVEVHAFGLPAFIDSDASPTFAVDVDAECNTVHDLEVVARDRAGNETRRSATALCDDQAPAIELGASPFFQEAAVEISLDSSGALSYSTAAAEIATLSEATVWPIRIEKLFNRLDLGSANLPTLRFLVNESLPAGTEAVVEVEYRYLIDGQELRPWTSMPRPASGGPYELPFSYQTLSPELATSGADALHRIELRAMDAARNAGTRAFEFYLEALSPPVFVTDCQVAQDLASHSLAVGNFNAMYQSGEETDVVAGTVRYLLELGPGSLAPATAAVLTPAAVDVRTRITELGEEKLQETVSHPFLVGSLQELANYCPFNTSGVFLSRAGVNETRRVFDQLYACIQGPYPNEGTFSTGRANDDDTHDASVLLIAASGAEIRAQPDVPLGPDLPTEMRVRMEAPVVTFGGIAFDWSTAINAPTGYALAQPAGIRYRTPLAAGLYRTGTDRWDAGVGVGIMQRSFETRSFVRRVEVVTEALQLSPRHATLDDVPIAVRLVGACAGSVVFADQL